LNEQTRNKQEKQRIEDDGYAHHIQAEGHLLWKAALRHFNEAPSPGTLILIRHGKIYSILPRPKCL
jgi:hypothetical protein